MIEEDSFGFWEYQCQGCDTWGPVNDLLLCQDCDAKVQRDLIRGRDWDYVVAAFGLDDEAREELRTAVIRQYGPKNELIAEPPKQRQSRRGKHHGKR